LELEDNDDDEPLFFSTSKSNDDDEPLFSSALKSNEIKGQGRPNLSKSCKLLFGPKSYFKNWLRGF
jgi:hypothetical protein